MNIKSLSSFITTLKLIIVRKKLTELQILFLVFFKETRAKKIIFKLIILKFFIIYSYY